jgi:hypothetical protein
MRKRWVAPMLAVPLLLSAAVAGAQAPPPAPAAPDPVVPAPGIPGNPTNPADRANNPHPAMPWVGVTTPYGQLLRWVWMPPQPTVANDQVVQQPGYWVAQTTAGYYYPVRWIMSEVAPGQFSWVLMNGGFLPFAR